jgi:outer membrane receptor protein involved in Fe transport
MRSIKLYSLVLTLIISFTISLSADPLGTTGKISGKITDNKTATPIVGAIIKVDGTNLGAESDATGDYVILNVPVGTYTVRCTYLGYGSLIQTDVRVSADITTTLNFAMSEKVTLTDTVEIIAKRNAISPDQSGRNITEEEIKNTGIRGIENIAAKTAGVVQDEKGTVINIRGGRKDETAIIIDGILTSNPLDGSSTAYVSNNLLQEMAVLTGGFSAEYGNVLSGIINVTTKSGTSKYSGTAEVVSDQIYSRLLNTNTQGYNLYSLNIGGPLVPSNKLKNFLAFYGGVERNFFAVANATWIADELDLVNNILPNYTTKRWSGNGKLTADFSVLNKKLNLKFTGGANVSKTDARSFVQAYMLFNSNQNPQQLTDNYQFYGKVNHQLGSKVFYDVQFNYFQQKYIQQNPEFKDNLFWYGDTAHVEGLGVQGGRVQFDPYGLFAKHNRVFNNYSKDFTQYYEGSLNLVAQYKSNEIKFGGNLRYHTIRSYSAGPVALALYGPNYSDLKTIFDGSAVLANYFGYNYTSLAEDNSKATEGDVSTFDGAKHPVIAAAYLQDKVEFKDFVLNAGLRFDYLDPNSWRVKNIANVVGGGGDPNVLDAGDFDAKSEIAWALSPRLGFSFPVTEKAIFHAQYGKFIQLPPLEFLYNGYANFKFWVETGGFAGSFSNPNLKPEKTTSYEIGARQQLGDKVSIDLTGFYKETKDLIGIKQYPQSPHQIQVYENQDYGIIRGFDLSLELRRTYGLAMSVAYSLSYASGTGSNPDQGSNAAWLGSERPKFTFPLNYDQRHTGTINLDYRFTDNLLPKKGFWKAVLNKLGINLLYSFNSGRPYTKKDPSADPFVAINAAGAALQSGINGAYGPWNHRLDLKIDKTVPIWKLNINFYAYVINVLNTSLTSVVWPGTGDPGVTGFLSTQAGMSQAQGFDDDTDPNTSSAEYRYRYGLLSKDIGHFGPPRQIRFGMRLDF